MYLSNATILIISFFHKPEEYISGFIVIFLLCGRQFIILILIECLRPDNILPICQPINLLNTINLSGRKISRPGTACPHIILVINDLRSFQFFCI